MDSDGTDDNIDNCTEIPNGPTLPSGTHPIQHNSNSSDDFIGNACDADFNQDCIVNFIDFLVLAAALDPVSTPGGGGNWNPDADISGASGVSDGVVNNFDLFRFKELFFKPPGPSAMGCN